MHSLWTWLSSIEGQQNWESEESLRWQCKSISNVSQNFCCPFWETWRNFGRRLTLWRLVPVTIERRRSVWIRLTATYSPLRFKQFLLQDAFRRLLTLNVARVTARAAGRWTGCCVLYIGSCCFSTMCRISLSVCQLLNKSIATLTLHNSVQPAVSSEAVSKPNVWMK
jgi:hypothetical protein